MSKIKNLIILLIISVFTVNFVMARSDDGFVPGISDLPVPANFYLKHDSASVFRNQEGRIVDATFIGRATEVEVEEFYNITLRALGWRRIAKLTYLRESEILKISTKEIDDSQLNNLEIIFSLGPQ